MAPDEVIVRIAYNGETNDLKWLWQMAQAQISEFSLPVQVKFFIDPLRVIRNYKGCKLYPSKSKLESLKIGCVWKHISDGENLTGAYDSLDTVKAQTGIFLHPSFVPYIDRKDSIQPIDLIFVVTE